ncbi:MAG: hypothetical protein AAGF60_01060 [Pseudomonadota bacterium]
MASRKALMDIERNPRLKAAWMAYLEKQGLDRAFEFATQPNVSVSYFCKNFMLHMTQREARVCAAHRKMFVKLHDTLIISANDKVQAKLGMDDATFLKALDNSKVEDAVLAIVYANKAWKGLIRDTSQHILTTLNTLAEGKFRDSNQYAAFLKGAIDPKKLAAEMDLAEYEVDEILAMANAVATGDQGAMNRSSRQIAANHRPKKGKAMGAAQIVKSMMGAMRKFKLA